MQYLIRLFEVAILYLLSAVALIACAQTNTTSPASELPSDAELEQYNAQVPPERRIVCRMETPINSNIARRVCYEARDIKEATDFHQEQMRRIIR
jgi:hypothetical protein